MGGLFMVIDKKLAPHLHNLVLVEGGARTIIKYKKLLLKRIKWERPSDADRGNQDGGSDDDMKDAESGEGDSAGGEAGAGQKGG